MMNKITSITRKKIFNLLSNGYAESAILGEDVRITFNFYGMLSCVEFLTRLYSLKDMPSKDSRLNNAEEDIYRHTILNPNDYPEDWLFTDDRFPLCNGTDEQLLGFLCEIFNPEVRDEQSYWKTFFEKIQELIKVDGYEFYIEHIISNCIVYGWRLKDDKFRIIHPSELNLLIALFNRGGYVLDLSTPAFDELTLKEIGLKLTEFYGKSKGKSLMAYTKEGKENDVIKLLVALFDYYSSNSYYEEERKGDNYQKGLEERHAKLAVGSSIILVEFLWCTHERTKKDN